MCANYVNCTYKIYFELVTYVNCVYKINNRQKKGPALRPALISLYDKVDTS